MSTPKYVNKLNRIVKELEETIKEGKPLVAYEILDKLYFTLDLQVEKKGDADYIKFLSDAVSKAEASLWSRIQEKFNEVLKLDGLSAPEMVSLLRVVERSAKLDQFYDSLQQENPELVYPGRKPLEWRTKCREKLRQVTADRLASTAAKHAKKEVRQRGNWVGDAIKDAMGVIREDMLHFRRLIVLFPPRWLIARTAVKDYHEALRKIVTKWAKDVEGNDIVRLLDFAKSSYPVFFMENFKRIGEPQPPSSLLDEVQIKKLEEKFVADASANMAKYLRLSVDKEFDAMIADKLPEEGANGWYRRNVAFDVRQLAREYLEIANLIGSHITPFILKSLVERLKNLPIMWLRSVEKYEQRHCETMAKFENKAKWMACFAPNIMGCCNDLVDIMEWLEDGLPERIVELGISDKEKAELMENIVKTSQDYQGTLKSFLRILSKEVARACDAAMKRIFTKTWFEDERIREVIVGSLQDYYMSEFELHMNPRCLVPLTALLASALAGDYIIHLIKNTSGDANNKFKPKKDIDRRRAGDQIRIEARAMEKFLEAKLGRYDPEGKLAPDFWLHPKSRTPFHFVKSVGQIIGCDRSLELTLFARAVLSEYPDVSANMLSRFLLCRNDLNHTEAYDLAEDVTRTTPMSSPTPTIASELTKSWNEEVRKSSKKNKSKYNIGPVTSAGLGSAGISDYDAKVSPISEVSEGFGFPVRMIADAISSASQSTRVSDAIESSTPSAVSGSKKSSNSSPSDKSLWGRMKKNMKSGKRRFMG